MSGITASLLPSQVVQDEVIDRLDEVSVELVEFFNL